MHEPFTNDLHLNNIKRTIGLNNQNSIQEIIQKMKKSFENYYKNQNYNLYFFLYRMKISRKFHSMSHLSHSFLK